MIQILFSSETSRRSQCIKRFPTKSAFPQAQESQRVGGICNDKKLTLIRMVTRVQATEHPFEAFTSFNPFSSFRHSRPSQSSPSILKILHPEKLRHSDTLNLPPSQKLWNPSIRDSTISNLHRQLRSLILSRS